MKAATRLTFHLFFLAALIPAGLFQSPALAAVNLLAPGGYALDTFDLNSEVFIDRTYYIESQPAGFNEFRAIRTANDDKHVSTAEHIRLSIDYPATVYIAYDTRASSLPDWMDGQFTATGESVDTTDVVFDFHSKEFPAGEVILGGNHHGGDTGAGSNYFVYIDEQEELSVAPDSMNLEPGDNATAIVSGGTAPYSVSSSNSSVATAVISDETITVTAVANGSANITITDSGAPADEAVINVAVTTLLALSDSCFHLSPGGIGTVTVSGGSPPYSASSANGAVATVAMVGDEATITAQGVGDTTVTVTDDAGGMNTVTVSVASLAISPASFSLDPGNSTIITVSGGTAPYSAISNIPTVADVTVSGNEVAVAAPAENAGGTVTVTIQDTPVCGDPVGETATVTVGQTPPDPMDTCPVPPFLEGSVTDPNILLVLDHSGSMGSGSGSHWDTAKQVFINIINSFPNVRFGLMRMDGSDYSGNDQIGVESMVRQGGKLLKPCGTPHAEIISYINNWGDNSNNPQTWTNLAEALATAGQYFSTVEEGGSRVSKVEPLEGENANLSALFGPYEKDYTYDVEAGASGQSAPGDYDATITDDKGNVIDTTSPIQYTCQQSFIIFVTDGQSNYDNDWSMVTDTVGDYDGDGEAEDCKEGEPGCSVSSGRANYLDDVAQFLYEHDMRSDLDENQNLLTYTVGFHTDFPLLEQAASQGGGEYYTAGSEAELTAALQLAISDIFTKISSGTAVSTISTSSASDDYLLRAKFLPQSWKGYLEAFTLPYSEGDDPSWEAGSLLNDFVDTYSHSYREIYTNFSSASAKEDFATSNGPLVSIMASTWGITEAEAMDWIDFLRGDSTNEGSGSYRDREGWPLGDIVYSTPVAVGAPKFYFSEHHYQTFKTDNSGRTNMIYIGANDGMLHAFRAFDDANSTCCQNHTCSTPSDQRQCAGAEQWAFIPENLYADLEYLVQSDCHRYYVDLPPKVMDIWDDSSWKTVLIGGNRLGGEDYFCLDVTDPAHDAFSVLWQNTPFPGMKSSTIPAVGKVQYDPSPGSTDDNTTRKWVALITSGYTEGSGNGGIAAFDFNGTRTSIWEDANGTLADRLVTQGNSGTESAYYTMSSPLALDSDEDGFLDLLYAGDTEGSLWKFYYDYEARRWKKAELFDTGGQFISTRPSAAFDRNGNLRIYFGTGKYLINSDRNNNIRNSFYCLIEQETDDNGTTANHGHYTSTVPIVKGEYDANGSRTGNAGLVELTETNSTEAFAALHSDQLEDISSYGWYFHLDEPAGPAERVISEALIFAEVVFFTSFTPNSDPCGHGGDARLYAVDYLNALPATNEEEMVLPESEEEKRYQDLGGGLPSKPVYYFDKDNRQPTLLIQTSDTEVHEPPVNIKDKPLFLNSWKQTED